jgi:hypothetical protein
MSRQEVGRAALRSLSSHAEIEEGDDRPQHYDPVRQSYQQQQQDFASSSNTSTSYFGGGALQITDSPTTSPTLGPTQFHRYDSLPRTRTGRSRVGQGSSGTPTTSDVPSLSLSYSSFSDGPLRSPLSEHAPSQTSISSSRTVLADEDVGMPQSILVRVANSLHMPLEDVRRVERCMSQDLGRFEDQETSLIEDLGRDRFYKIVGAVRAEEDRLSQLSSFRSAYLRAAETDPHQSRHRHAGLSSTTASRSPPLANEQLEFLDRSRPIPSPRAALELLTASNSYPLTHQGSPHSPLQGFEQSFSRSSPHRTSRWNTSTSPYHTHTRQTSAGSRPIALPDRSYRSMDDYMSQSPPTLPSPVLRGESRLSVRRSIHDLITPPIDQHPPLSRRSSRSPLIDSPQEDDDMEETLNDEDSLPQKMQMQHLRPSPSQSRQRSASGYDPEKSVLTKPSRRASAEVLGQAYKRAASPSVIPEEESTSPPNRSHSLSIYSSTPTLSHEEVMARLQRKVKERLAAKNAGLDYSSSTVIVGGRSKSMKAISSPILSKHSSLPYGTLPASLGRSSGRRRQEIATNLQPPSTTRRSTSNNRRQVKSPSLRGIVQELDRKVEAEDAKMEDVSSPIDSGTAGMGIEALLSAAAIADTPRQGFI